MPCKRGFVLGGMNRLRILSCFQGIFLRRAFVWAMGLLAASLFLAMSYFPLQGPHAELDLSAEERAWLKAHKESIRIPPSPNWAPLEFFDDEGRYCGLIADYMHLVEKKLGIRFQYIRASSWTEILSMAKKKEVDLLPAAANIPARRGYLGFTSSYFSLPNYIIVNSSDTRDLTIDDLSGLRIVLPKSYVIKELYSGIRCGSWGGTSVQS